MDLKGTIDEMKGKGIETALVKREGGVVYSTFAMEDPAPFISQYLMNNAHFLMAELGDEAEEVEISQEGKMLIVVPLKQYILLAIVKSNEDKKSFREYAKSIKSLFLS